MILTLVILILVVIAIILSFYFKNWYDERKVVTALQSFAKVNNCTISSYDHWYKTMIGIDNNGAGKLFFIRNFNSNKITEAINLSEIINCRLVKSARLASYNHEEVNVIDKIELVLTNIDFNKSELILEFYNNDNLQLTLSGELQFAEKWSGIINNIINLNKKRNVKVASHKLTGDSNVESSKNKHLIQNKTKNHHESRTV